MLTWWELVNNRHGFTLFCKQSCLLYKRWQVVEFHRIFSEFIQIKLKQGIPQIWVKFQFLVLVLEPSISFLYYLIKTSEAPTVSEKLYVEEASWVKLGRNGRLMRLVFCSIGRVNPEIYALAGNTWNYKGNSVGLDQYVLSSKEWLLNYANVLCLNAWQVIFHAWVADDPHIFQYFSLHTFSPYCVSVMFCSIWRTFNSWNSINLGMILYLLKSVWF